MTHLRLWVRSILVVCAVAIFAVVVHARVVNSKEDLDRLKGFSAEQKERSEFQKDRLADIGAVKKERAAWEAQKQEALMDYKKLKAQQQRRMDEGSVEYREDLVLKSAWKAEQEMARQSHLIERNKRRQQERAEVAVTEERELGLDQETPRVEWNKRVFIAGQGGSKRGSRGGRFSGSPSGSSGEAPPPEFVSPVPSAPPLDSYDDAPIPPPPPPPPDPMYPPGSFDDGAPPFFDDSDFINQ